MKPTRALAWVLAWVVVVAVGSTLVWAVISRAGHQVVASNDPLVATSGPASPRSSHPSSPTASPDASASTSTTPPEPGDEPQRRSWQGVGGLIVAECTGATIKAISLVPDNGYAYEFKDDGPDQLEVEFEGRDDESVAQSSVRAECVDGVPVFELEVDDD